MDCLLVQLNLWVIVRNQQIFLLYVITSFHFQACSSSSHPSNYMLNSYQILDEYTRGLKPNIKDQARVYLQEDFQYLIQSNIIINLS